MSFFSRLFSRKITYIPELYRDKKNRDLLHVFGGISIMPDDGDSFTIWRHCVLNTETYVVTKGFEQRGSDFEIDSPFAGRAVNEMSRRLNRILEIDPEPIREEIPVHFGDVQESDTVKSKKLPSTRLHFIKLSSERGVFSVQLCKDDISFASHKFYGDGEYFCHPVWLNGGQRLLFTFRQTGYWGMAGGMAFAVLDGTDGRLLHNAYF